jgi:WD40 repeat protein
MHVRTCISTADNSWDERTVPNAHQIGCNAVSWAPSSPSSDGSASPARLVSGGCDGVVRVWLVTESGEIKPDEQFDKAYTSAPHSGWVRDVAWAPLSAPSQHVSACVLWLFCVSMCIGYEIKARGVLLYVHVMCLRGTVGGVRK